MRNKGNFVMALPNGKNIKFRTREAFSVACEVISHGRYSNIAQMYERVKQCMTGFEYGVIDTRVRDTVKRFNEIEFGS